MNYRNTRQARLVEPSALPVLDPPAVEARPSHHEIAHAAFGRWKTHGGDAEQNWLLCERVLSDRRRPVRGPGGAATRVPSLLDPTAGRG